MYRVIYLVFVIFIAFGCDNDNPVDDDLHTYVDVLGVIDVISDDTDGLDFMEIYYDEIGNMDSIYVGFIGEDDEGVKQYDWYEVSVETELGKIISMQQYHVQSDHSFVSEFNYALGKMSIDYGVDVSGNREKVDFSRSFNIADLQISKSYADGYNTVNRFVTGQVSDMVFEITYSQDGEIREKQRIEYIEGTNPFSSMVYPHPQLYRMFNWFSVYNRLPVKVTLYDEDGIEVKTLIEIGYDFDEGNKPIEIYPINDGQPDRSEAIRLSWKEVLKRNPVN